MAAHTTPEQHRAYKQRKVDGSPRIPCGCGCGELMPSIKSNGTPRRFINGHLTREQAAEWGRRSAQGRPRQPPKVGACSGCGGSCSYGRSRCRVCANRETAQRNRIPAPGGRCRICGSTLTRQRRSNGRLEDRRAFMERKTCSPECQRIWTGNVLRRDEPRPGATSKWTLSRYARRHMKEACEECGSTERLEAHHRDGDRANNAPENIETLCKRCHLKLRHPKGAE